MAPSEDPQRNEVILVAGASVTRDFRAGKLLIKRDEDKTIHVNAADAEWSTEGEFPILAHFWHGYIDAR